MDSFGLCWLVMVPIFLVKSWLFVVFLVVGKPLTSHHCSLTFIYKFLWNKKKAELGKSHWLGCKLKQKYFFFFSSIFQNSTYAYTPCPLSVVKKWSPDEHAMHLFIHSGIFCLIVVIRIHKMILILHCFMHVILQCGTAFL